MPAGCSPARAPAATSRRLQPRAPRLQPRAPRLQPRAPRLQPPCTQAGAGALFGSGQYSAAAEAYTGLLDDFLDFHPGLASHERCAPRLTRTRTRTLTLTLTLSLTPTRYAALLANRAACRLAQRELAACEADCAAALGCGAPLAPKQRAKLLLRRAEALRLQGRLDEAADDLRSTSRLPLDPPTRALLVAAEEELEAQRAEAGGDTPATSPKATGGEAEPAAEEAAEEEAAAAEEHTVPVHQVSVESGDGGKRSVVITVELPEVQ